MAFRQSGHAIQWFEHDMDLPVPERALVTVDDPPLPIDGQPISGNGRAGGDMATQVCQLAA
jgi:hypothetical protein